MSLVELFIIAVGLSMDAFAVAICRGLCFKKVTLKNASIVGLYFGLFQAGMPLIGYILGVQFQGKIIAIDHWIAFVLLGIIGINMIRESRESSCEVAADCLVEANIEDPLKKNNPLHFKKMTLLALATSVDALAVGITFAFLQIKIGPAVAFIGLTTFTLSALGVKIGSIFGSMYKSKAEFAGGLILILMGLKILFEHLGIISF